MKGAHTVSSHEPYRLDLDWVWGHENRQLDGVATLRATVADPSAHVASRRVDAWLDTVENGSGASYWQGGWAVEVKERNTTSVVLDLISGGQDVADSLSDAVSRLQRAVCRGNTTVAWEPQPIELPPN
jgi:hypothetical protein